MGSSFLAKKDGGSAQIAIYDSPISPPRVVGLAEQEISRLIEKLASKTYDLSKQQGGSIPYIVIREVVENLIHAYFKQAVISILDRGNTIKISDQGPGIENKESACRPGFSTASAEMKQFIRGVGSGLPVASELIGFSGGNIKIEDNLSGGTVITLSLKDAPENTSLKKDAGPVSLSLRQTQVLSLVTEAGAIGPSGLSSDLGMSLSTAHRELICLEGLGLVKSDSQGKRQVTAAGIDSLSNIISNNKGRP